MTQVTHTDVGAYALGLLEEPDRQAFEEHLAGCTRCQAELDEFSGLAGALTDLDGGLLDAAPPVDPPSDDSVVELRSRRPGRARPKPSWWRTDRLLTAAAAIVLLVGGTFIGSSIAGGDTGTPPASDSIHRPAGELLLTGQRFSATDRATGTTGIVGVESRGWGTHLALELRGVHGPLTCQLIAVSRTGERQVAMSWKVPRAGYGVPGAPEPLVLHGATSMPRADVARVEIRTSDGKTLLNVRI